MSEPIQTIRIVPFSGKADNWNRWSKTFLAIQTAKGNREVIMPVDPKTKQDGDKNTRVYSDLMLSCQDNVTFGIVEESTSKDFPQGDTRLA